MMPQHTNRPRLTIPEFDHTLRVLRAWLIQHKRTVFLTYGATVVIATILSFLARAHPHFPGDALASTSAQEVKFPFFTNLMETVSYFGEVVPLLVLVVLFTAIWYAFGYKLEAAFIALSISGDALAGVVKLLVDRPRPGPPLVHVLDPHGSPGYPSDHVIHYMVFYGLICYFASTQLKPSPWRTAILWVSVVLVTLVGPSRIYLGAHWFSDVVGGYLLGAVWLVLLILLYRILKRMRMERLQEKVGP